MSTRAHALTAVALGRYRLGPLIGRGATATVHRALDLEAGGEVAVKVIPAHLELAPRVRAEIRAAVRLDHPGVVQLLDWGEEDAAMYLVSELVEGSSFAEALASGRIGERTAVRVARDVLAALAHAHGRGVVHRDVKPANILVDRDDRGRLTDFGVARLTGESGLTATGAVVGTMAYMAPEQARGGRVGAPADVYATALVLYEALAGHNPLAGESPAETARRAAEADIPPLAAERPDLPRALLAAVDTGLRRSPRERPDATDLAQALGRAAGGIGLGRGAAHLAPAASAVGGAGVGAALALGSGAGPLVAGAVALVAGAAFALRPRAAAFGAALAGAVLVALLATVGGAVALGVAGAALLAAGGRFGRLTLLPAAMPALAAVGLAPLYALAAGLAPTWPRRLWAATAGVAVGLAWQVAAGTETLMFGGPRVPSAIEALRGEVSPLVAAHRLTEPLLGHPAALAQAGALVAAAMLVPLVLRARPGSARALAAGGACVALLALLAGYSLDPAAALVAALPAAVIVMVWTLRPWRNLRAGVGSPGSATLRDPTR